VLVSRSILGQEIRPFVQRFRLLSDYASVPLILLVGDKDETHDEESIYSAGFTQVFSRTEFDDLRAYIQQVQSRHTFEPARHNKVVIIEDCVAQQMVVSAILEAEFCECFCFTSAEEALAKMDEIQPQVIACDFFLEGKMTALDFVVQVKKTQNPWQDVPILVMSGFDDSTRKYELVRAGANDYIPNPIEPIDLTVRVENLIRYQHLLDKINKQKKEMHFLAMHDQLTGLYNRHFVSEQVQQAISESQRHHVDFSIIVLDIDLFKQVNDKYGHDVGDRVLQSVGNLLQAEFRDEDSVARIGGEEFLILLNHCSVHSAADKAESLRSHLQELKPAGLAVTASFGVAQLSKDLNSFDKLFKAADMAVYRAKEQGRNQVEVVPPQRENNKSIDG
jgi:two-component system cell cycle response regulator